MMCLHHENFKSCEKLENSNFTKFFVLVSPPRMKHVHGDFGMRADRVILVKRV
jgi:hypothetical protein